jgi:hypothetical protein
MKIPKKLEDNEVRKVKAASTKVSTVKVSVYLPKDLQKKLKMDCLTKDTTLSELFTNLGEVYLKQQRGSQT